MGASNASALPGRTHRVAVLGGTGFVGRPVCRTLRDLGHDVVVIARDGTEAIAATWVVPQLPNQGGTTINGSASIRDADVAAIAIRGQTGAPLVSIPV